MIAQVDGDVTLLLPRAARGDAPRGASKRSRLPGFLTVASVPFYWCEEAVFHTLLQTCGNMFPRGSVGMTQERMARSDVWRLQYRGDRYARHLSHVELTRRFHDVLLNLLTVTPGGIGFRPSNIDAEETSNESTIWMEKATHVLEEFALRYGPYPAGLQEAAKLPSKIPEFASELARRAAERLEALGADPGDIFVKFGKRKFMEMLHSDGALRIQPETYFAASAHNEAVRDDELTVDASLDLSREEVIALVSNPQEIPDIPRHRVDVKLQLESDYWLYCLTSSLVPRLFIDYDADSCVVIRDRVRFTRSLTA